MWDFAEVCHGNQRNIKIARKLKGKCFSFFFFLNKVPKKGPGTEHIHIFKANK
jgi:hypothetical protein